MLEKIFIFDINAFVQWEEKLKTDRLGENSKTYRENKRS